MVRVIQAGTPQQCEEIYRLRHQICVDELGYQMVGASAEEGDEHALLFLAYDDDGRPAGTLAINRWSDGPLGPATIAGYQLERFTQSFPPEAILVGRKLLVTRQHRSGALFFDLLRAGLTGARAAGQHFVFLDCSPDLVAFYTRLGCRRYAPSFRRGDGTCVPLCLVLTDHVHLDQIRSPFLGLLRALYSDAPEGRDHFARCQDDVG